MGSLIEGDTTRVDKIFKSIKRFGPIVSVVAYLAGLVYFCLLPHEEIVHGTYISENALMPGLVTSDVHSSDIINTYYELLKSHYELKNYEFDMKFIHELFQNHAKIEAYIQHFNVSNPFYDPEPNTEHLKAGRNVYAFARSQRADGTESIVVSAPVYVVSNNKHVPNFLGIAQLFVLADLAKNQPYWAKDIIFVVTEQSNYGMQAWVNSYYDIQSNYIKAEDLKKRGGSIQAALNLEFPDIYVHKLELKIEGANGKLPNLDLFNSIIVICTTQQFECTLEAEKGHINPDFTYYNKRNKAPIEMREGVENLINMVFKQAHGAPSSLHGYFLNHRIEALTISGAKSQQTSAKKQNPKQNLLKATRIIESSLRSVNNLLERFHQSFFFYLLPSSQHYVSIANYMPVFGLIALPIIIEVITIWFSIFLRKSATNEADKSKSKADSASVIFELFNIVLPNILLPAMFGFLLYFGSPYFIFIGKKMNLAPKESIIACYIQILVGVLIAPFLINTKPSADVRDTDREYLVSTGKRLTNLVVLLALVIFLGTLSLLNFSLALLLAVFYVPVSLFSIRTISNKLVKFLQLSMIVLATPMLYFCVLYLLHSSLNGNTIDVLGNFTEFYQTLSDKFYRFVFLSKICNIWTQDLVHLCLIPIWSALWFIAFPR